MNQNNANFKNVLNKIDFIENEIINDMFNEMNQENNDIKYAKSLNNMEKQSTTNTIDGESNKNIDSNDVLQIVNV